MTTQDKGVGMKYYAIKTPEEKRYKSNIFWIASDEWSSWQQFFSHGAGQVANGTNLYTARKAYEAIGYRCVEFEITEYKVMPTTTERELLDNLESESKP